VGVELPESAHVHLRPATVDDLPWMYEAVIDPRVGGDLRLGGAVPSFEEFRVGAWSSVVAQWMIVAQRTAEPGISSLLLGRLSTVCVRRGGLCDGTRQLA
jgi:hypothetical protein